MSPQRQEDVIKLLIIRDHHAAFHRRDVVAEEGRIAAHYTEGTCLLAVEARTERLAVVFDDVDLAVTDNAAETREVIGVAQ
ncbi:hypothetical protein D3C87_1749100 [compost metagenome]